MEVMLFGITREIVGERKLSVAPSDEVVTVGALKAWLVKQYPGLQKLTALAVAVDSEYADDDCTLSPENEIALIPPVSGG